MRWPGMTARSKAGCGRGVPSTSGSSGARAVSAFSISTPWCMIFSARSSAPTAITGPGTAVYGIYNIYPYYDADTQPWWGLFRGINLHCMYYSGLGPSYFDERLLGRGPGPDADVRTRHEDDRRTPRRDRQAGAPCRSRGRRRYPSSIRAPSNHLAAVLPRDMPADGGWEGQNTGSPDFVYPQHWEAMSGLIRDFGPRFPDGPLPRSGGGSSRRQVAPPVGIPFESADIEGGNREDPRLRKRRRGSVWPMPSRGGTTNTRKSRTRP